MEMLIIKMIQIYCSLLVHLSAGKCLNLIEINPPFLILFSIEDYKDLVLLETRTELLNEIKMAFLSSGNATVDFGPIASVGDLKLRLQTFYSFQESFGFLEDVEETQAL